MFEKSLTKENTISNLIRYMIGIDNDNMDTKIEYLQIIFERLESDGLDIKENFTGFGVRNIKDPNSLEKEMDYILSHCRHSANYISIEFDIDAKFKIFHAIVNLAVIANHTLKLPETMLLKYLADKWFEEDSLITIVNNLKVFVFLFFFHQILRVYNFFLAIHL